MASPERPKIIETPNHFWFGATDLAYACQGDTKVEKLHNGYVKVTKTFVAESYQFDKNDGVYKFSKN